jgi:dUTP pyrophosphatase
LFREEKTGMAHSVAEELVRESAAGRGAVLSASQIRALLRTEPPLLEQFLDLDTQLQPNGFDLTLAQVERFVGAGRVDFSNAERRLSETVALEFEGDWLFLDPGAYKVRFHEVIHLPRDIIALGAPRTSLLRSGVTVETGFWDAGYEGISESLLVVFNEAGFKVKRKGRLIQLVFLKLSEPASGGYRGVYASEQRGRD